MSVTLNSIQELLRVFVSMSLSQGLFREPNKKMQILWGLILYFLITWIGTELEKARQDVTDYKLELKISVCMLVNFEFRIFTWNFEFLLNFKLRF